MTMMDLPSNPGQGIDLFRGLPSSTVQELTRGADLFRHRHRDVMFRAGETAEHFGVVVSGCYKLLKPRTGGGDDTLLAFATRGEPIGLLIMSQPHALYPITAQALGLSSFLRIPRKTYLESWLREPELTQRLHSAVMQRCQDFHSDRALQHLALPSRVAGFLLRCLDHYGVDGGNLLRFPLSRKEIAEAVGAQVESVIRVMSAWQKAGVVTTSAQYIEVLEPSALVRLVSGKDQGLFDG